MYCYVMFDLQKIIWFVIGLDLETLYLVIKA